MVDKRKRLRHLSDSIVATAIIGALLAVVTAGPALSLSELKEAEPPAAESGQEASPAPDAPLGSPAEDPETGPETGPSIGPAIGLPDPDPIIRTVPQTEDPDLETAVKFPPVDILTDLALLPEPVRRMRQLIIEAATTGEIDRLRALLGTGPTATQLAFGEVDTDPVAYLRSISGDGEGQEILAILIDLLNTGFLHVDVGEPSETFVWPYFVALPLEALTPPQKVELLRLVTAGDVEDMKAYGAYNFYRIGISPEGEWAFFVAGD
ncbi:MAG: hypothetical protein U1A06_21400 [Hoeflea sp.]|nr:hypothetical protein [Hoeflea sp.]